MTVRNQGHLEIDVEVEGRSGRSRPVKRKRRSAMYKESAVSSQNCADPAPERQLTPGKDAFRVLMSARQPSKINPHEKRKLKPASKGSSNSNLITGQLVIKNKFGLINLSRPVKGNLNRKTGVKSKIIHPDESASGKADRQPEVTSPVDDNSSKQKDSV